jgi:hypothetical protein
MRMARIVAAGALAVAVGLSGCAAVQEQAEQVDEWNAWVDQANATMAELNASTALDTALAAGDRKTTAAELKVLADRYLSIANGPDATLNLCYEDMATLANDLAATVSNKKDPTQWVAGAAKLDAKQAECNARVDQLNAEHGATAPG